MTLFDEPYAGLDAVARQIFYDRLLADYAAFPRTVLLSTHLIDEAAALFENVVVIDRGRVVLDTAADGLRGMAATVSGPVLAVNSFTQGRTVWERRGLGSQASVVMVGQLSPEDRERARSLGLDLTPLSLQQLVVRASAGSAVAGSFAFAANVALGAGKFRDMLAVVFVMFFVTGVQRIGRWLPFGLALGATRRSFYAGTALLGVSMSLVYGLVIAGLQAIERATGGWGLSVSFFRVPYLMNGPWYATWLTSFVGLSALFVYGMWYGIVNRRWGMLGLLAFLAVQVLVALAITFAYTLSSGGPLLLPAGGHPATLSVLDLTAVIAALTVVFLAGGHATICRVTV